MDINKALSELAQYIRMQEEAAAMVESIKDQLKSYMIDKGMDEISGSEHKVTYKAVTSTRIDTSALKKAHPDIASEFSRQTTTRRFILV